MADAFIHHSKIDLRLIKVSKSKFLKVNHSFQHEKKNDVEPKIEKWVIFCLFSNLDHLHSKDIIHYV